MLLNSAHKCQGRTAKNSKQIAMTYYLREKIYFRCMHYLNSGIAG